MQSDKSKLSFLRGKRLILTAVFVLVLAVAALTVINRMAAEDATASETPTFAVRKGPLRISVTESGTIQAQEQIILKSEVEGKTTILSLVEEGTVVKTGDLLVELDSSRLQDERIDQQIQVQNAEAAFIGARENLAVVENQAQSDVDQAQLTLDFAQLDLKKYLEGEYQNELTQAESEIKLAQEELQTAKDKLKWSEILFDEKYLSQTELQIDELAKSKRELDLKLAKNNLDLLEKFTHPRMVTELESNVKQAKMALERTQRKASADVVQAKADLWAKESEFERQKDKLKKIDEQIVKTKIYAPADGLAIYATSAKSRGWRGSQEPLDEGQEVYERQELIYLPTASSVKADVKIHEASLEKVALGLGVLVTVDALPGRVFTGRVEKIAPLPDAQSIWLNPDLKVYNTDVYLDGDGSELRTGMSCRAEIVVKDYDDVVYVPLQAVIRVGVEPTVYVANDNAFEARKVELGLDNNRMVRIINGLEAGEVVLLTPSLESGEVLPPHENVFAETAGFEIENMQAPREAVNREDDGGDRLRRDRRETGRGSVAAGSDKPDAERTRRRRDRFEGMSDEQREQMRQRHMSMSEEEREKMRRQVTDGAGEQGTSNE